MSKPLQKNIVNERIHFQDEVHSSSWTAVNNLTKMSNRLRFFIKRKKKEGYFNFTYGLEINSNDSWDSSSLEFSFFADRLETDDEFAKRTDRSLKAKAAAAKRKETLLAKKSVEEKAEREMYEILKKKFEGK